MGRPQGPCVRALAQKNRSDGRVGRFFWARARALGPRGPLGIIKNILEYIRIYQNILKYIKIYQKYIKNIFKYIKIYKKYTSSKLDLLTSSHVVLFNVLPVGLLARRAEGRSDQQLDTRSASCWARALASWTPL